MFDPPRYATRGVVEAISTDIQLTLWAMVDWLRLHSDVNTDYLQVFELAPSLDTLDTMNQAILHRQQTPSYVATNLVSVDNPVTEKVFVIDDGVHATMMLAEEY